MTVSSSDSDTLQFVHNPINDQMAKVLSEEGVNSAAIYDLALKVFNPKDMNDADTNLLKKCIAHLKKLNLGNKELKPKENPASTSLLQSTLSTAASVYHKWITPSEQQNLEAKVAVLKADDLIHELDAILADRETFLDKYPEPPPSCETRNYLKQEIRSHLMENPTHFAEIRSLLDRYSIGELQKTNITLKDLLTLGKENPRLLEKTVKLAIPFGCKPKREMEVILDLALELPEEARPMIHEIIRVYPEKRETSLMANVKPLINHFRTHLKTHRDPEKFICQLEKLIGLWLFQPKLFQENLVLPASDKRFDKIFDAMDKIENLDDIPAVVDAVQQVKALKNVDWKSDLLKQLGKLTYRKSDFEKVFLRQVELERGKDRPPPASVEECLKEMNKPSIGLPSFMALLGMISSSSPEFIDDILPFLDKLPFRGFEVCDFFAESSPVGKVKLEQLINEDIGLASALLSLNIEPKVQEELLFLRDRFQTVFGEEKGDKLWHKILKSNPPTAFIYPLAGCTDEELSFYEPLYGQYPGYLLRTHEFQLLKTPESRRFYYNVLSKMSALDRSPFLQFQAYTEALEKLTAIRSVKVATFLMQELFGYTGTDKLLNLVEAGFPLSLIEKMCESAKTYKDVPARVPSLLLAYFLKHKDSPQRDLALKRAEHIIDFVRIEQETFVNRLQELMLDPNKEKRVSLAFRLMDEGRYEAVSLMLATPKDKLDEFMANLPPPISKEKTIPSKGDFAFSPKVQGERAKLEAAVEIAEALISKEGSLDAKQIGNIMASGAHKSDLLSPNDRNSLQFKLDILNRDPYFGARLEEVTHVPSRGSELYVMLQKVLGKEEITLRDVRVALLSGLLWPTRQGGIGSCFSTSIVIQSESSPAGLRQTFEDFISILENYKLSRTVYSLGSPFEQDYPVFAQDLLTEKAFANDHLLSRAREFTIASFASAKGKDSFLRLRNTLVEAMQHIEPSPAYGAILEHVASRMMQSVFLPAKKDPLSGELGAWCLYHADRKELIDDWPKFRNFLKDFLASVKQSCYDLYPENAKDIDEIFDGPGGVTAYVDSFQFRSKLKFNLSSLGKINPVRYEDKRLGPWVEYGTGGNSQQLISTFFGSGEPWANETSLRNFSMHDRLKFILDTMIRLPKPLRQQGEAFAHFKVPITSNTDVAGHGSHAYSLEPHATLELAKQYSSSDAIISHLLQQSQDLKKQVLTPTLVAQILGNMKKSSAEIYDFYIHALTNPDLLQAKSVGELWNRIEKLGAELSYRPSNMPHLDALFVSALAQTELKDKIPILKLGDTNWEELSDFSCYYSFYNDEMTFAFSTSNAAKISPFRLETVSMNPKMVYHHDFNLVKGGAHGPD